jgi:hypothetical protein
MRNIQLKSNLENNMCSEDYSLPDDAYILVEDGRRFRADYCLHHHSDRPD